MSEQNAKPKEESTENKAISMNIIERCYSAVCRISLYDGDESGSGMILKVENEGKDFRFLVTNHHVINEDNIKKGELITVEYCFKYNKDKMDKMDKKDECKVQNIKLSNRKIKTDYDRDVTIIEIKEEDEIAENIYLELDKDYLTKGRECYLNKSFEIVQFPRGGEMKKAVGKITEMDRVCLEKFSHDAGTDHGSSGSPIILTSSYKVIGIHYGSSNEEKKEQKNFGSLLGYCFDIYFWKNYQFEDGIQYLGRTVENKKEKLDENNKDFQMIGYGQLIFPGHKVFYEGEFLNGRIEGIGKFKYENGNVYIGKWKNYKREGFGIYDYKYRNMKRSGSKDNSNSNEKKEFAKYSGNWKNDKKEGHGIITYENGDSYDGEWKDDKKHGKGKYIFANGDVYDGYWEDDKIQGEGEIKFKRSENKYNGKFEDFKKQGKGKFLFRNGDEYNGEWKDDQFNGKGEFTYYSSGNVYNGDFKNGQKEGHGTFTYGNKFEGGAYDRTIYDGDWKEDMKEGDGKITYSNGDIFNGKFSKDKRNGKKCTYEYCKKVGIQNESSTDKKNQAEKKEEKEDKYYNIIEGEWKNDRYEGFEVEEEEN